MNTAAVSMEAASTAVVGKAAAVERAMGVARVFFHLGLDQGNCQARR